MINLFSARYMASRIGVNLEEMITSKKIKVLVSSDNDFIRASVPDGKSFVIEQGSFDKDKSYEIVNSKLIFNDAFSVVASDSTGFIAGHKSVSGTDVAMYILDKLKNIKKTTNDSSCHLSLNKHNTTSLLFTHSM